MKRLNLSVAAFVTAALAAALLAAAALGGIASSQPNGTTDWIGCIAASGCAQAAHDIDQPTGVAIADDQGDVMVASFVSNAVDVLHRDRKSGLLSQLDTPKVCVSETGSGGACGDGRALQGPSDLLEYNGDIYVASTTSNAVAHLQKDSISKRWSQPSDDTGCTSETGAPGCRDGSGLTGASSVAIHPTNHSKLWVGGTNSIAWFERNKTTGTLTETGCINDDASDGCVDGFGMLGTVTQMTVTSDAKFLYAAVSGTPGAVVEFSIFRGALTELGCFNDDGSNGCTNSSLPLVDPQGLQANEKGTSLYVAANGSNTLVNFASDRKTGLLSTSECFNQTATGGCLSGLGLTAPHRVRVCENGRCLMVSAGDGMAVFTRSTKTGALTQPGGVAIPCWNSTGTLGCTFAPALHGAMGIDSISGGIKQIYVAGSNDDAVSEFHLH